MSHDLRIISSMATRKLLAEISGLFEQAHPAWRVQLESVGGVDAAKRVAAGEAFDLVVLADDAIERLMAAGHVRPGSRVDLVHSSTVVGVREGSPLPDIGSEAALRAAVLAAPTLGYSTGPSGVRLQQLFERWGIAAEIQPRIVQAPPGVPVASLVAQGQVALGFQQRSEMLGVAGVQIVGALPDPVAIDSTFSASVAQTCRDDAGAQALLTFWRSSACHPAMRAQGLTPA